MKDAKERAERQLRFAEPLNRGGLVVNPPLYRLHQDVAALLMVVSDLTDRLDRAETAAATLRTELQQEREAREEMAATVRELAEQMDQARKDWDQ